MIFARTHYARWHHFRYVGWDSHQHFAECWGSPALVLIVSGRASAFVFQTDYG